MKEKKRLEVFWETHEITTISFKRGFSVTAFCRSCRLDMPHLSIDEAAALINMPEAEVFRLAETGEVHCLEMKTGVLLVCLNSFKAARIIQKGD